MKKRSLALLLSLVLMAALLLTGCGGMSQSAENAGYAPNTSSAYRADGYDYEVAEEAYDAPTAQSSVSDLISAAAQVQQSETEKMIYTAYATVETLEFEKTTQAVQELLTRFGAYVESSSISGTSYNSSRSSRTADYTVRVPVQNYTDMSVSLAELGNVTRYDSSAENITSRYVDTEARLRTVRTEYERLIEMLEAAEDADLLICEATYGENDQAELARSYGHMTFAQAGETAARAGARRLWLAHYSQRIENPADYLPNAQQYFPGAVCGQDGLGLTLRFDEADGE